MFPKRPIHKIIKFFLFLLAACTLLLLVQCIRHPHTTLSNMVIPFWQGQGLLPVDAQNDEGNVDIRLIQGGRAVNLSIPAEYLVLKVQPEMESVVVKLNYETLEPVSRKEKRNPKIITAYIHLGQDHMEKINTNDFEIFQRHGMLANISDNMWKLKLENNYEWRQYIRDLGTRASRYHWIGGGDYIFYIMGDEEILLASCPALCGIRSNINKEFYVRYALRKEYLNELPYINRQIERFINNHRKD